MSSPPTDEIIIEATTDPSDYGGFVSRLLAHLIDWIILAIPLTVISSRWPYFSVVIAFLYYPVFEGSRLQATIGKRAMNLIVTDEEGQRISVKASLIRFFASFLSAMFLFAGYLIFFFTKRKQTLHDLFARTVVVYGRREGPLMDSWLDQIRSWAK